MYIVYPHFYHHFHAADLKCIAHVTDHKVRDNHCSQSGQHAPTDSFEHTAKAGFNDDIGCLVGLVFRRRFIHAASLRQIEVRENLRVRSALQNLG